jgi:hypothetical protein
LAAGRRLAQYSVSLHEFLGYGINKISIVTSALLAAISLFYVFTLASHLQVNVYYFLLRWTYIKTSNEFIVTRYFDSIIISSLTVVWLVLALDGKLTRISVSFIFGIVLVMGIAANRPDLLSMLELATLPVIVFFLLCQKYYQQSYQKRRRSKERQHNNVVRNFSLSLTLNYLIIIAIILGIYSILISLSVILTSQPIPVDEILTSKQIPVNNYGYEVFIFFSALSPLLLIVIYFCLPVKLLTKTIFQRIGRLDKKWWLRSNEQLVPSKEPHKKKTRALYLSLFVLISIALALIPQLPTVNKDNQQIGSDSEAYVEWITSLQKERSMQDFLYAVLQLHQGDRPLSLIFLFLVTTFIDAPTLDTIEYLPVVLGPALVFVVYFLTRELTSNETASLFAASLTGLGYFHVSTGIYAGFYANWIALLLGYTSLIFFFRFLRASSTASLLVFFALLVATLFSHAYTWNIFTIVMSIFLIVSLLLNSYPRRKTILLLAVVLSTVIIDGTKAIILEPIGSEGGVELTLYLAQTKIVLKGLGFVWETLVFAIQNHFGAVFSNFIILGLVIYWFIRSNLRTDFNRFITVFLMVGIPSLFVGDWLVQTRVFYNIPFQIPAGIALTYLSRQKNGFKILTPIYVWLMAIAIWTVSNFYAVSPS